jgi:hypothetical protein
MQVTEDPQLKQQVVAALRTEFGMDSHRPGMHQSELSYCLTKAYWERTAPMPPTETEVTLWSIGFALERVIFVGQQQPEPLVLDGVTLSLDSLSLFGPVDLKSTRMRANGRKGEGGFQVPDRWKKQMAAYTYALIMLGLATEPSFGIVVMHLVEPKITAWQLTWEMHELAEHWAWLMDRSNQLENMLATQQPMPYQSNESWECEHCRYSLMCSMQKSLEVA